MGIVGEKLKPQIHRILKQKAQITVYLSEPQKIRLIHINRILLQIYLKSLNPQQKELIKANPMVYGGMLPMYCHLTQL